VSNSDAIFILLLIGTLCFVGYSYVDILQDQIDELQVQVEALEGK
jgi:hypothetical protein